MKRIRAMVPALVLGVVMVSGFYPTMARGHVTGTVSPSQTADRTQGRQLAIRINGTAVPVPPYTHVTDGQVMVPIRWAAEQLGASSVAWEPRTLTVVIRTDEDLYKVSEYDYYIWGIKPPFSDIQLEPLPQRVKNFSLPPSYGRNRQLVLVLPSWQAKYPRPLNTPVDVAVYVSNQTSPFSVEGVCCYENHNGHLYLPMDWLEELFYVNVNYDQAANELSIQSPDVNEINRQIADIRNLLMPATPAEAMRLWGLGEQIRNGALQYIALSPGLRQQADRHVYESGWSTGWSSPWMGQITVIDEKKLNDKAVEYTVSFPEITCDSKTTGTEKYVVSNLKVDGKSGWFITDMLESSGYGLI